ncbi:alpha/beta fold hydrolase [Microbacterium sp.]|uniref:alpha/beta fold hydrolase n=1 Tax=Microbacterium sp. TaxID=51671 RepID=UPI003A85A705
MRAEATPIVLLHGVGLDATMWEPVIRVMGDALGPVVAVDLPGHGTRPPLREPQSLASLAADVIDRIPPAPLHLVGFSLGALIAQHIARFSAARVATLACVSSVCRRTPSEAANVASRLAAAGDDFAGSVEASIARWFPPGTAVSSHDIEATRRVLLANDVESYLHAYAVFARGDREIAPALARIHAPTLAITGADDPGSTPEMSRRLADAIPNCRVEVVPGTRHMMPLEDPVTLVAAIATLLNEGKGHDHD